MQNIEYAIVRFKVWPRFLESSMIILLKYIFLLPVLTSGFILIEEIESCLFEIPNFSVWISVKF